MPPKPQEGYKASAVPNDDDVEGHGMPQSRPSDDDVEGHGKPQALPEDDVEGHQMLPMDVGAARQLANAREREIRRDLQRHDYENEARRPHNKHEH